jgi:urocanate hydratase
MIMMIKANRGSKLECKGWKQEAILRMLQNNLENAEKPDELIIYGGSGKAVRNWECYDATVRALKELNDDETLLIQSGKPVGIFRTHKISPRVLIANANIVPRWSTWEKFYELEKLGLIMYGQMTAGGWSYIGTQGIIQGTYETFAACARTHFGSTLESKFVLSGGLGGMGGAQPLAIKMNRGVALIVEVDETRIKKRIDRKFCDIMVTEVDEALDIVLSAKSDNKPISVGLVGNTAEILPEFVRREITPDIVTDQTPAHDPLRYIPKGLTIKEADELRQTDHNEYIKQSFESMAIHVRAILKFIERGAVAFDYGNNLREQAYQAGVEQAFSYPGFITAYIRPMFCEGRGPFRWVALSGNPEDIYKTDKVVIDLFPENKQLSNWITLAEKYIPFEGLPARVCWLGYGERAKFGKIINRMVRDTEVECPIVITRDHLDCGSVSSPYRETENMKDKSDVIADWPILNALLNCSAGADLIAVHNGGGVGIGYSIHAGMLVVADGSELTDLKIEKVLTTDPGIGIVRHADAGYESAIRITEQKGIKIPMLK